jgi:hypothetical protein
MRKKCATEPATAAEGDARVGASIAAQMCMLLGSTFSMKN